MSKAPFRIARVQKLDERRDRSLGDRRRWRWGTGARPATRRWRRQGRRPWPRCPAAAVPPRRRRRRARRRARRGSCGGSAAALPRPPDPRARRAAPRPGAGRAARGGRRSPPRRRSAPRRARPDARSSRLAHRVDLVLRGLAEDLGEELGLGGEVPVDGPDRDPRPLGHRRRPAPRRSRPSAIRLARRGRDPLADLGPAGLGPSRWCGRPRQRSESRFIPCVNHATVAGATPPADPRR